MQKGRLNLFRKIVLDKEGRVIVKGLEAGAQWAKGAIENDNHAHSERTDDIP